MVIVFFSDRVTFARRVTEIALFESGDSIVARRIVRNMVEGPRAWCSPLAVGTRCSLRSNACHTQTNYAQQSTSEVLTYQSKMVQR